MTTRQLRLLRAASASAVATLIAGVSHTIGGGSAPHPLMILAVAAFLTPVSAVLIGSRPSRARVAFTIAFAQTVFHLVFQFLGSPVGTPGRGAHSHHLELSVTAALPAPDAAMIGAHAVAALLTTLLVWHGEAALRAIAGWMLALLLLRPLPLLGEHLPAAPLRSTIRVFASAVFSSGAPLRGPPALLRG